jgi:uncharacterized protein YbdZ (MbtH family)
MSLSIRIRLGALMLVAAGVLSATGAPAAAAPVPSVAPAVAQDVVEGWSCSPPPAGYTYVALRQFLNTCGAFGVVIKYNVALPLNGMSACSVPTGWATTSARLSHNSCAISGTTFEFKLATPTENLWSCNIPQGWTSSQQRIFLNACSNGQTIMFQLTRV